MIQLIGWLAGASVPIRSLRRHQYLLVVIGDGVLFFLYLILIFCIAGFLLGWVFFLFSPRDPISHFRAYWRSRVVFVHYRREHIHFLSGHARDAGS